jgi:hypothetical protein
VAERALKGLQRLPFVGLVEAFEASVERLQRWLEPAFPEIRLGVAKLNVTQAKESTLEQRLLELKEALGPELYRYLVRENQADLEVYRRVAAMY